MKFGNLENLYYLIIPIIILIILIIGGVKRNRVLEILNFKKNTPFLMAKILFISLGSLLVMVSLLSPEKLLREEKIQTKSNNIYILIDTSRSMLATDVYPNRIEKAKILATNIIENLKGDKVGIIPFSDSAYIQMPLTDDYSIGKNYISAIDTNLISGGGTKIDEALRISNSSFEETESHNKIVLVISDGGDENKEALDYIKKHKITVFSIGIGSLKGSILPDNKNKGFIKDKSGNIVTSRLNSKFLRKLSSESKGRYYEVNNLNDDSLQFIDDINLLEKDNNQEKTRNVYKKYYQIFLGLGFIFIILGYFLRKKVEDEE